MKYVKKYDIIYIATLGFLILGFAFACFTFTQSNEVVVEVDGKIYGKYNLYENQTIVIEDTGQNVLVINEGEVFMESADCPDKICVSHYAIRSNTGSIVCLPNKVIVYLETKDEYSEVDVIV